MPQSSGKKVGSRKAHGWEEAGNEFYQENYGSECDTHAKNAFQITTFLPSKHNRLGTYNPNRLQEQNSKYWQPFPSTSQKENKQSDVQFSVLPDLSQVLTDEGRIWEEILQIKHLPLPMQHKRNIKINLQCATKLRLQGFNQLKWKQRKAWKKIALKWSTMLAKMECWHSSLKKIEGNFGTGAAAYFRLLRWLFFLNLLSFGLILTFIILPNILHISATNSCNPGTHDNSSIPYLDTPQDSIIITDIFDIIQGGGPLQNSLVFYGAFSNKVIGTGIVGERNCSESHSLPNLNYDLSLAYFFVSVVYFLLTLIVILRATTNEFKDRMINKKWQFYQYCNITFSGWDYCIHNSKSSAIKHKGLKNEIKYLLQSKRLESKKNSLAQNYLNKLVVIRILINIVIVVILFLSAYSLYFIFDMTLSHQSRACTNNSTNNSDTIDGMDDESHGVEIAYKNEIKKLLIEFLPYISIVFLNICVPPIFNFLCKFEKYSLLLELKLTIFRTLFLRFAFFGVLLSRFHYIVIPNLKARDDNCWESFVGQQFFKLVITDFVTQLCLTFCVNFPRALFASHVDYKLIKFLGEQEFELPKHVLDVVYSQTLCWIGYFYTPVLPACLALIMFCLFYVKKFQCLVNSTPSKLLYGVSRTNSIFMVLLLICYMVALVPISFSIAEIAPSSVCGAFREYDYVWSAAVAAFVGLPEFLKSVIQFIGTAAFAIPSFVVLILLLYYFSAVSAANRNMVKVLKNQLVLEGHDKQFLLNRLSVFLKQQQDDHEINVNTTQKLN